MVPGDQELGIGTAATPRGAREEGQGARGSGRCHLGAKFARDSQGSLPEIAFLAYLDEKAVEF